MHLMTALGYMFLGSALTQTLWLTVRLGLFYITDDEAAPQQERELERVA